MKEEIKNNVKTDEEIKAQKGEELSKQLEEVVPYSVNLLLQEQMGLPVNQDKIKNARFVLSTFKSSKIQEKEEKKLKLQQDRFGLTLIENYGDDKMKSDFRDKIRGSVSKMKFLE